MDKLGNSKEKLNVIDLLSGLGENWTFLKRNFPNSNFYALDFSENMINLSKQKADKIFGKNLNLICDNLLDNKLESNSFDIVSCAYGLKTFNEEQLNIIAKEVHRILKPNGKFSFVEVSKPKNKVLLYFYSFYLGKIIPILGKIFLGNPEDYKMLWIYTSKFQSSENVKDIFEKHGLEVNIDKYFGGCASGLNGKKINK
ncbi:class I SAM-dependent methyltransferase [Faecalibacter bovis]|uniref:class I SAM-dependent methyltransferase n=1 Tax=Faecalibacter bovis TaxID=2898187 RepID=UPI0021D47398|nr:class I SAM-dependent methyltransferase [Faecalibacter bovis]